MWEVKRWSFNGSASFLFNSEMIARGGGGRFRSFVSIQLKQNK